jgi:ketosteroid isomerase-like protein
MSQENVELLRRLADALTAGEPIPEFVAADHRSENVNTAIADGTYTGPDGLREWRKDMFSGFGEDVRFQVDEVIAESDDYVVAVVSLRGRGAASGARLDLRWTNASWFRDGMMVRSVGFERRGEALKAVGLEE